MAAETEIERLLVRLVGDGTSYQRMLKEAEVSSKRTASAVETAGRRIEAIGTRLRSAGAAMSRFGRRMSLAITLPLSLIGGASVRAFANFDKAMTESTSIMGNLSDQQVSAMRDVAKTLSTEVPQSATKLAESYFFLASAGKSAEQSMSLLPRVSAFATAGAFDMAEATDLLTDAQSALGLTSKNVAQDTSNLTRVSDVLVKANTLANASVRQFSVALTSKAGAALKVYNKDVEEGVAVLAALADQGVKAELAGNALDRVIRLLSKSQLDNKKALEQYNVEVFDSTGSMKNMADIIEDLEIAFATMSDEQRSAALAAMGFEARVQAVILPLIGTSKAIRGYEKELRKAGGTTQDVAEKQMKSFSNQIQLVKNQLALVGIEIGEVLAPFVEKLGGVLKEGARLWRALPPEIKKVVVIVGLAVAAIGPLLILFGGFLSLVGFAISGLGAMAGVLASVAGFIAANWLPVLIAVTTALAGGALVMQHWGDIVTWFGDRWASLIAFVQPAIDGIKDALMADDLALAAQIGWAQIKLAWAVGIQGLEELWVDFTFGFKLTWIEAIDSIKSVWQTAQNFLAKGFIKLSNLSEQEQAQAIAILESDFQKKRNVAERGKTREQNEAFTAATAAKAKIQSEIDNLTGKRDTLAAEAAAKAAAKAVVAAIPGASELPGGEGARIPGIGKLDLAKAGAPPGTTAPGRTQATLAGTAEAKSSLAEYRFALNESAKKPMERVAEATEGLLEIAEEDRDTEANELQPANL